MKKFQKNFWPVILVIAVFFTYPGRLGVYFNMASAHETGIMENTGEVLQREKNCGNKLKNAKKETNPKLHLLVAIDNSGSMSKSGKIVKKAIQSVYNLIKKENVVLSVDYILFNEEKRKYMKDINVPKIKYGGETSVYQGIQKINSWINAKVKSGTKKGIQPGVLVISDFFSSRDKNKNYYTLKTARSEQKSINALTRKWNRMISNNKLRMRLIQWESLSDNESSSKTLEIQSKKGKIKEGFQVQVPELELYRQFLGSVYNKDRKIKPVIEQKVIGNCICEVLKLIFGIDDMEWLEEPEGIVYDKWATIEVKESFQLLVRIDSKKKNNKVDSISYCKTGKNFSASSLFKGDFTEIYYAEDIIEEELEIILGKPGFRIHCLYVPVIGFSPSIQPSSGRVSTEEDISLELKHDFEDNDIRWRKFVRPEVFIVEITSKDSGEKIFKRKYKFTKEKILFRCPEAGKMKLEIYYKGIKGKKHIIRERNINVTNV